MRVWRCAAASHEQRIQQSLTMVVLAKPADLHQERLAVLAVLAQMHLLPAAVRQPLLDLRRAEPLRIPSQQPQDPVSQHTLQLAAPFLRAAAPFRLSVRTLRTPSRRNRSGLEGRDLRRRSRQRLRRPCRLHNWNLRLLCHRGCGHGGFRNQRLRLDASIPGHHAVFARPPVGLLDSRDDGHDVR
eukprot:372495-Rhodomonas_salina.1